MEMGAQNQQKINQNTNSTAHSFNAVNNFQGRNCNANYKPARKHSTRYPTVSQNYQYTSLCTNGGQLCSHKHRQIGPANGIKCNNCGITGNFARKCRKPKKSQTQISKPPQTKVKQIDKTAEKAMMKNPPIT